LPRPYTLLNLLPKIRPMSNSKISHRRILRIAIPGLLIPLALALIVLAVLVVQGNDALDGEAQAGGGGTTTPTALPLDVAGDQRDVFAWEAAVATANAPTPTPEPTATPAPSPFDIAAAELPYVVPPPGVAFGPDERWIAVSVSTQRAYAFVGGKAVYEALVTTGAPGSETPLGDFRINYRKEKDTMDSETIGIPHDDPNGYFLEDVYWTQYFYPGVALHSNYWRPVSYFGNVASSHGCVGMLEDDAKFFWDFARYGTRVVIYN